MAFAENPECLAHVLVNPRRHAESRERQAKLLPRARRASRLRPTHRVRPRHLGLRRDPVPRLSRSTSVKARQASLRHRRVVSIFRQVPDLSAASLTHSSNIAAIDCSKLASEGVTKVWILCGGLTTWRALLSAPRRWFRARDLLSNAALNPDETSSLEQAHDALVLFDVPAVLVVVFRDRQRTDIRALRFPHAGARHPSTFGLHSRAAQLVEIDLHSRQDTIELRDVARSAVVR